MIEFISKNFLSYFNELFSVLNILSELYNKYGNRLKISIFVALVQKLGPLTKLLNVYNRLLTLEILKLPCSTDMKDCRGSIVVVPIIQNFQLSYISTSKAPPTHEIEA